MSSSLVYLFAVGLIAAGLGLAYLIVRQNERPIPRGAFQWAGVTLSLLVVATAGLLLVLAFTMEPGSLGGSGALGDDVPRVSQDELDRPAEDFSFRLVGDDTEAALNDYSGRVLLVNFWATWCAPCLSELPDLNRLQKQYRDAGLTVLTLSDEPRTDLLMFREQMPLQTEYAYLPDPTLLPQPFLRTLAVRPTTYLIDREGNLREFVVGGRSFAFFEQMVKSYLDENLPAG